MTLTEKIQSDLANAMRMKDALRLSVLRMMKSAVKNKEVEKMKPLEELTGFDTLPAHHKGQFREWIESLAFTIIFVLVFTSYVAQATQVPTESMKPTILVGDHFFLDKIAFPANYPAFIDKYLPHRSIKRGDIIAFKSPTDGNIPFVKRVIGIPGDTVEVQNKSLYVNGTQLEEHYKIHVDSTIYSNDPWTLEEVNIRDTYGP